MKFIGLFLCLVFFCTTYIHDATARRLPNQKRAHHAKRIHRAKQAQFQGSEMVARFDVDHDRSEATETSNKGKAPNQSSLPDASKQQNSSVLLRHQHRDGKRGGQRTTKKLDDETAMTRVRDSSWYYCANEELPRDVSGVLSNGRDRGLMCQREYPTYTCCADEDLTAELVGSQIVEQIQDVRCSRMLMKLRCAHCSPRSWWLFHAPDRLRLPHKRMIPILCPHFCRKFQQACGHLVEGLRDDSFCDLHTTNESGPCFPDYEIRRGNID